MMNKALLLVDYSNDFVADGGALSCGALGQAADPVIAAYLEQALEQGDHIFICNDDHDPQDPYDPERALFPAHNLRGSWGQQLYGNSGELARRMLADHPEQVVYLPKTRYSAFFGTPLLAQLQARGVRELLVMGVCTDICVLHTVIDAVYTGFAVSVPRRACATPFPYGEEWAFNHMQNCLGVTLL